jgi:hypothetical protein
VYDITDRKSFQKVQTWLESVHQNASNEHIVVTLVG